MATIELKNIWKHYEYQPTVKEIIDDVKNIFKKNVPQPEAERSKSFSIEDLSLTIPDGQTLVILGPSGCGKSTLLRIIAGLIKPESGEILYDGVNVADVDPGKRRIGMIFQDYALYPHLTSKRNILSYFFFRRRTPELDEIAEEKYQKTSELLGIDISYLMDRFPPSLSGGEKQRVALGRCITRDPALFLLDEPFSNLDQKLRDQYRVQLKTLLNHFHLTTVYVTHDQQEALVLGDQLAIMNIGKIEQVGAPEDIYNAPYSRFVAEFLNPNTNTPAINFIDGQTMSKQLDGLTVGVRSEDIELCEPGAKNVFHAVIQDVRHIPIKRQTVMHLVIGTNQVYMEIPVQTDLVVQDKLWVRFKRYHFFDKQTGLRVRTYPE